MDTPGRRDAPTRAPLARALAIVALLALVLPLAAAVPLLDPDEGLHAAIAQEMLERGDLVTPTFLGEPFLDKPVFFFWTEAASLRVLGSNETAVRLPPLLFGLLGALTTAWLASALFDRSTGLAAGIVYATLLLPLAISETAVHDVALVPFMNVAVLAFWRVSRGGRTLPWAIAAGVCLGASILTKGLVGVAFAGIAAAAFLAIRPRALGPMILAGAIALALAAAIAAPWYVAMERAHPGYVHYYFVDRHLRGFLTSTQQHAGRPWWYYLPILIGGTVPWIVYVPFLRRRSAEGERAIWLWLSAGLVLLSIADSKLVTYALPLFPAAAILLAAAWMRTLAGAPRGSRAAAWAHGGLLAVLPLAAMLVAAARFQVAYGAGRWTAALGGAAAIVAIGAWRGGRRVDVVTAWSAVFLAVAIGVVLPAAAPRLSARGLAQFLNGQARFPVRLAVVDERVGSVVFYLRPELRRDLTPERLGAMRLNELRARLPAMPADSVIAVRRTRAKAFERFFPGAPGPYATTPDGEMRLYRADALLAAIMRR